MTDKTKTDNELIAELGYKILRSGHILGVRGNGLKTVVNKRGYEQLNLTIEGKTKSFLVHRLVASEYHPNPENKPEVNHLDGNKLNNYWSNLEWTTRPENIQHGIDTGLIPKSMLGRTGHRHHRSKQVKRYDIFGVASGTFESTHEAARILGLNATSIQDACRGKLKTYKGYSWTYH